MEAVKCGALGVLVLSLCTTVLCQTLKVIVQEGASADMECNYPNSYVSPRVEWKFNSDQDTSLVYYDGSLTASYKDQAKFYPQGLQLIRVNRKDQGEYVCEVTAKDSTGKPMYTEIKTMLTVLVPPSAPVAQVPTSVSTGSVAELICNEKDSSPPATFTWYKDKVPMPVNPKSSPTFKNSSYTLDPNTGILKFGSVMKSDAGDFYCEAGNSQGKQVSAPVRMEVKDINVGGIVAAVIVVLVILVVIGFGLWYAYSRGYIGKKSNKKVIYSSPRTPAVIKTSSRPRPSWFDVWVE